jgi:hypothetical protein
MRKKRGNEWDRIVVAIFRDSYSPGHDGFCCVQLSISENRLEFAQFGSRLVAERLRRAAIRLIG